MNETIIVCPECGYQRQSSDSCPDYECPKCGIVYAKYVAKTQQGQQPEVPSNENETESVKRIRMPSFGLKYLIVMVSGVVLLSAIAIVLGVNFTDYGNLRYRYWIYTRAFEKLDFEEAYRYLSSSTRKEIVPAAWRYNRELATDMRETEVFKSLAFSEDGRYAKIISIITIEGKETKPNYQTWVKEDGTWFRGYIDDYRAGVRVIRSNFAKKQNEQSRPELQFLSTSWDVSLKDMGRLMVSPRTNIVIANKGEVPITHLMAKVAYYDKVDRVVISESETVVVSESDTPLLPNEKSKNIFLDSVVGFTMRIDTANVEQVANRIERRIYFRRQYNEEWMPLSSAHLVAK